MPSTDESQPIKEEPPENFFALLSIDDIETIAEQVVFLRNNIAHEAKRSGSQVVEMDYMDEAARIYTAVFNQSAMMADRQEALDHTAALLSLAGGPQ